MSEKISLALIKPIQAHGENVTALEFRELTGNDMIKCGFPFLSISYADSAARVPHMKVVAEYICELAQIPMSSVGQLHPVDFSRAAGVVLDFFAEPKTPQG
jgi:hypothetical protein